MVSELLLLLLLLFVLDEFNAVLHVRYINVDLAWIENERVLAPVIRLMGEIEEV